MNYRGDDVSAVITTAGNRASELLAALESVVHQSEGVGHIYVVWDLEKISAVMSEFIRTYPDVKHLLTGIDHGGVSRARNFGIANCNTELIAILDDDDIWYPNKIAQQLVALNRQDNDKVLCLSQSLLINEEYEVIQRTGKKRNGISILEPNKFFCKIPLKSSQVYLPTSSMIFSKNLVSQVKFNQNLKTFEDIQFIFEASHAGACFLINEPLVLTLVRKSEKTGLSHVGFDFDEWTNWVQKNSLLAPKTKGNILIYFGTKRLLQANHFRKAFGWILISLKLKPDFHTFAVTTLIYLGNSIRAAVLCNMFRRT